MRRIHVNLSIEYTGCRVGRKLILNDRILKYIETHKDEVFELLVELAQIPAPSNQEEKRAEFIKNWLVFI